MTDLRKAAEMALETAEAIANAKWQKWEELATPEEFERWAKSRATHIAEALRQALAQPVDAVNMSQERVDETVKGEHEPVCFLMETSWSYEIAPWNDPRGFPVYTAPRKKEWVGLTDEEIYDYADKFLYSHGSNYVIRSFGKALEAKLKEKNV